MAEEKLLTIRDVSLLLGVSEKEVMELAEKGTVPAYKIAGMYLRFKRHEIDSYRTKMNVDLPSRAAGGGYSLKDRLSDFFYFNDFYILSAVLIVVIMYVIFKG